MLCHPQSVCFEALPPTQPQPDNVDANVKEQHVEDDLQSAAVAPVHVVPNTPAKSPPPAALNDTVASTEKPPQAIPLPQSPQKTVEKYMGYSAYLELLREKLMYEVQNNQKPKDQKVPYV